MKVPIVAHYKHLGGYVTRTGSCLQEIRIRAAATMAKLKPLRKILQNKELDIQKRSMLVQTMGVSVLTLHAGTWFNMTQTEFLAWQAGVFRTYQAIQPRTDEGQVQHLSFYHVASAVNMPMPMELLYIQRLRLLFHVMSVQDKCMIQGILENHSIAGDESWLYGAIKSIKWMRSQVGNYTVPEELDQLQDWETWALFAPFAKKLQKDLKQVKKAHMLKVNTLCAVQNHANRQNQILTDMGWNMEGSNTDPHDVEQFACDECNAVFTSAAAVAVHQQRKHGHRMAVRRLVKDGGCRACGKFFHTRPRVLRHLHMGNTDCWIWHCRRYKPMSQEETQQYDDADRKRGVAMHQQGFVDIDLDRIWRRCTPEEMTDIMPCRDVVQSQDQPVSEEELRQWSAWGMLPPGRGGRSTTQRKHKDMHMYNVSQDLAALEQKMLQQVDQWEPDFSWVPRPLSCGTRFFLVLFSGHRRYADMAQWFSWTSDIVPICIDLAVDPVHGNVLKDGLWIRLIRARKVTGAHAGPPCETYSFARWLEVIGGCGPRPLRDTGAPWGRDHLTLKEGEQVYTGTILMLQAIYLLMMVFLHGGSFTLEHPKGQGGRDGKWSIWDSAFLKQLMRDAQVRRVDFIQGPLGQPFTKPTSLLSGRLDRLAEFLFDHYQKHWKPSEKLGGKDAGGKHWNTAKAKAYPPLMCKALVQAHVYFADQVASDVEEDDPEDLQEALDFLAQPFDPYSANNKGSEMKADYWGHNFTLRKGHSGK